jgi:hypothetical protein
MKKFLVMAVCGLIVAGSAFEALAASARVRCRIQNGSRLRVQVDGQNVSAGKYSATLTNLRTQATASTDPLKLQSPVIVAPARVGNVDLDFDSTAQRNDKDSRIAATFARSGDGLRAVVNKVGTTLVPVASATTTCTQ